MYSVSSHNVCFTDFVIKWPVHAVLMYDVGSCDNECCNSCNEWEYLNWWILSHVVTCMHCHKICQCKCSRCIRSLTSTWTWCNMVQWNTADIVDNGPWHMHLIFQVFGRPFIKRFVLCYWTVVLSVSLSVLSVMLMYCGQMIGRIKMKLGMQVGLGPGHIVFNGDPALPLQKKVGTAHPASIFSPCLLWPNGWMDQDATWYGIRPQLRPHCVRREPSSSSSHAKVAHVYCGHGRPSQLLLSSFYLVILFYQTFYMSLILWLCLHVGNPKYNSTDSMSGSSIPIR